MIQLMQDLKLALYGKADLAGENLLRKARALHRSIPLVAQSLVETTGTKIRIRRHQGPGAATDGKTIWLMDGVLPMDAKDVDRYLVYVALKVGLVHHEVGHVNETDFNVELDGLDPLARKFLGILEDVRQENRHIQRFKGGRKYLDSLCLALFAIGLNGPVSKDDPMLRVFTAFLLYTLRNRVRHQPHFLELAEGARDVLIERLDRSVVARLEAQLHRAATLRSTSESLEMAKDLAFLLREEERKAQQQQQRRQQQQGQQAPTSNGPAPDGSGDAQSDVDGSSSAGEPDQDSAGDSNSQPTDGDSGDDTGANLDDDQLSQLCQRLNDLLNGDINDAMGDLDDQVRNLIGDLQGQIQRESPCTSDKVDMDSILAARQDVSTNLTLSNAPFNFNDAVSAVGRLSARLKQKLQAESLAKTARSATGTRIYTRHLTGVATGDPRIFRKTHRGIATDTAVFLLGDISSSMEREKIGISNQAMYACALAMQRIPGVDVAVGAFPGRQMVLRFGERARHYEGRFNLRAHGNTPMEEGVLMAHTALSFSKCPRKMLMVTTDGAPNDMNVARASLDFAHEAGIEVYGIGIQTDYVRHVFDQWTIVNSVHDLPNAMITMLSGGLGVELAAAS